MSGGVQVAALSARIAAAYELARVGLRLADVQKSSRTRTCDAGALSLAIKRLNTDHLIPASQIGRTLHRDHRTVAYHLGRRAG